MKSIKKELTSGVFYSAISKYVGLIVSLIVVGILARLIAPEEFGIVAVATVIISFFNIFSDLGIAPAIIQNKCLTKEELSHIFSFTLWVGLIISVLFFLFSGVIASFYESEKLSLLCKFLSLNLFFATVNIVPNALLYKNKEFRFIAYRNLFIQSTGGVLAIIAALKGAGIYALIVNPIYSSIMLFTLYYKKYPQSLYLSFKWAAIKKIFSFSVYQFMFNVINYFSRNLDKLLIGKYLNMQLLGYYEKSYRLMMLPLQNITHVISPVMHPVLSQMQDNLPQLSSSYEKVVRIMAFIGLPLSALLYFCGADMIYILFGSQWGASISSFQILALSVGIQIILSTSGSIFQAANDTKSLFICGLFSSILNVSGICVGIFIFGTLEAIAWAICTTFFINFVQCYIWMYIVTLKRNLKYFIKQLISPILLTAIVVIILFAINTQLSTLPSLPKLIINGIIYLFTCTLYIQLSGTYNIMSFLLRKISEIRKS